ncbi:MAG TPA: thioredoxin domain-containing protein [Actinomycetota bacterium]|nr:thioredoxin domain-containing protein [Actinomycetota bacterium]
MPNRLARETSPFLLQHAEDPVDWYPWGEEAWSRAVAEDKPVFVSIGYASCHWCHVMHRESFADPEIAKRLNASFIAILVDREERPDLDSAYLEALQTLMGDAGWPMNIFLTPQRKLFFGGTYFPPSARDELPSFGAVLESVTDEWQDSRAQLDHQADDVVAKMRARDAALSERRALSQELWDKGILAIQSTADLVHGGFGEAPKFPQPCMADLMLRAAVRGPGGAHGAADLTLRRMARGGIYDQLGGGFHRYASDEAWAEPHFEKLLHDNALLARAYTHAWQSRPDPLFRRVALETLDYLVNDLRSPEGAFFAGEDAESLTADGTPADGAFYRWDPAEVHEVAPEAAAFFTGTAPWNPARPTGGPAGDTLVLSAAGDVPPEGGRAALREARSRRPRPAVDRMILTSWNGLAIGALAEAGRAFDRPDLVEAARTAAAFLLDRARTNTGGLFHLATGGNPAGTGLAEDYAYLADGLFALWEATFESRWLEACEGLARYLVAHFADASPDASPDTSPEGIAGIFSTPDDGEALVLRRKDLIDGVTPSANGVASLVLQRLGTVLGDAGLERLGVEILEAAQPVMAGAPQGCAMLYAALDYHLAGPREIVLVGPDATPLRRVVEARFIPNRVLVGRAPGEPGIASPLLAGRPEPAEGAIAYVCERGACRRPTSDPDELARQLHQPGLPTPEQLARAAALGGSTLQRITLLERLDNPRWIDPLHEQGFFRNPPGLIDHYLPGVSGAPPWPDSKYLAKMAGVDPFAVHRVALAIPDTDNSLVQEDLTDAALALPPDLAADLAARAEGWLRSSPYHVMLPKKLGALMAALAKGGRPDAAIALARVLLELLADTAPPPRGAAAEEGLPARPQPCARFSAFDYVDILKEHMPAVTAAAPLAALDLLADVVASALVLSTTEPDPVPGPDGSHLWRPAINEDPRNLDRTVRSPLVTALRDAAELAARENPGMLSELCARLETRGWAIFRRLALHLLAAFPQDAPAAADERLADVALLDDPVTSREWLLLARSRFPALSEEERERIRAAVRAGPTPARWDPVPERWAADPDDAEAAEAFRIGWVTTRLDALEAAGAEPPDGAFAFLPSEPPVDLTTPKQAEWLRSAPAAELVVFCRRWRPPGLIGAPTEAGFQIKLAEVVTSGPEPFAVHAGELAALPDAYLRAVIAGFREAIRQGSAFPWEPVLALFEEAARSGSVALRTGIARTLGAGFTTGDVELPHELGDRAWGVIEVLAGNAEVAAEALQAAVRYALWRRRQVESGPRGREIARSGWETMPEVRVLLEAHLAAGGAAEVRAAYGQWFPWLLMLDPTWAIGHRDAIFGAGEANDEGEDGAGSDARSVAWDSYVARTSVFDQVFDLLADDYRRAIDSIAPDEMLTRPRQGLVEHLIGLYLRGRIPLQGSPLGDFFDRAPADHRAYAMSYIGQMLGNQEIERVPGEILGRLMKLWESRVAAAGAAAAEPHYADELAVFGAWFASGRFESGWAVRQLSALLSLTGRVGNTSKVVERLKAEMDAMPYEVTTCIAALVASEVGAITILGWGKDAQQILSRIVGGSDPRARDIALDLLDTFDLQQVAELVRWR